MKEPTGSVTRRVTTAATPTSMIAEPYRAMTSYVNLNEKMTKALPNTLGDKRDVRVPA